MVLNLLPKTGSNFPDSFNPRKALTNADVANNAGWVVYISGRRGDSDFDGEYDMEDLLPSGDSLSYINNGVKTNGEDANNNGVFENDYVNEAPKYSEYVAADVAAVLNTRFYCCIVRLINGTELPGNYDSTTSENTKGLTMTSKNGVYVIGNYNSTDISLYGSPTPSSKYLPQNSPKLVPASVVADFITLLSNGWRDTNSFASSFDNSGRTPAETTYRFAALLGNGKDFAPCPDGQNQGTDRGFDCQSDDVHSLLRYLENWNSFIKSNYTGSLINLFNSTNSNNFFKCCMTVYEPPFL